MEKERRWGNGGVGAEGTVVTGLCGQLEHLCAMPLAGWREGEVWVSCQVGAQCRQIGFCTSCLCSWPE